MRNERIEFVRVAIRRLMKFLLIVEKDESYNAFEDKRACLMEVYKSKLRSYERFLKNKFPEELKLFFSEYPEYQTKVQNEE